MNLLFIGERKGSRALKGLFGNSTEHRVSHCADEEQAIVELSQGRVDYDLVILDGHAILEEQSFLSRACRAMGSYDEESDQACSHAPKKCNVSWETDGTLRLQCCMSNNIAPFNNAKHSTNVIAEGHILEFQAPCRRKASAKN